MIVKLLILCSIISFFSLLSLGQKDWGEILKDNITPKAFAEVYYGTEVFEPEKSKRPDFIYNYKRLNELGLNSAVIGFDFDYRRVRSSISFIAGNYATYNLSSEPQGLNHIYEANFGYKLLKHHNFWLDVGVMESNLGFEGVISSTNNTMTRSLLAESSPYYLNAAKLSYKTFNKKWEFELLLSNGWQKMTNGNPSLGHTLKFHPNENWTINSSSFVGSILFPDNIGSTFYTVHDRFFHNFYVQRETEKSSLTVGFDYGLDYLKSYATYGTWLAGIAQYAYSFNKKLSSTVRLEYFYDYNKYVTNVPLAYLDIIGLSANIDLQLHELITLRVECRYFQNRDNIFLQYGSQSYITGFSNQNIYVGSSLSIDLWNH